MAETVAETRAHAFAPRDLIEMVFRHRRTVLIILPGVFLAAVLFVLFAHRMYQSEMKILVQNTRGNLILSSEKSPSATTTAGDVTEQQINSQIEILHSRDVLDPVVEPGWAAHDVDARTSTDVKRHDRMIEEMEKHLGADPVRKSNIITVTYAGRSPREAQDTLQRLSASFLSEQRRLLRPAGATEFFNVEAERYRNGWNEASKDFVAFQQRNQLVSLPDEEASIAKQIAATQDQLRLIDNGIHEVEGKIVGTRASQADANERQTTAIRTLPNQQSAQELTTLLVTLENKRTALLTQFKLQDRLVQEVDQQIAQTRFALSAAQAGSAQERTTDVNPAWQQIRTATLQNTITRSALYAQRSGVQQQLAELRIKLANTQSLTVQYNLLKSRADSLQENYNLYVQKMEQAQIEDAMDERKLMNVSIAEQPTLSYLPISPKPVSDLALGLLSACFLTFAFLYFSELGRVTIASPRELEATTGKPVLATVPLFTGAAPTETAATRNFIYVAHADALRAALDRKLEPEGLGI